MLSAVRRQPVFVKPSLLMSQMLCQRRFALVCSCSKPLTWQEMLWTPLKSFVDREFKGNTFTNTRQRKKWIASKGLEIALDDKGEPGIAESCLASRLFCRFFRTCVLILASHVAALALTPPTPLTATVTRTMSSSGSSSSSSSGSGNNNKTNTNSSKSKIMQQSKQ
jgi:hypothetical protein